MADAVVTIVLLGRLADLAECDTMTVPAPLDWSGLLAAVGEPVATALAAPGMHVALDGKVLPDPSRLMVEATAEIALLPPVSGG